MRAFLFVLGDEDFVRQARRDVDPATEVIPPGGFTCGRYIDNPAGQIVVQPGWKPTGQDRAWAAEALLTRLARDVVGVGLRMLYRADLL